MKSRASRDDGHRRPRPRPSLPEHEPTDDGDGVSHADLVEALPAIDGLVDVTGGATDRPNFHLRHAPFLHFHNDTRGGGLYADVRLGGGKAPNFEPVWASTPNEREDLLRRVRKHVRRAARR